MAIVFFLYETLILQYDGGHVGESSDRSKEKMDQKVIHTFFLSSNTLSF